MGKREITQSQRLCWGWCSGSQPQGELLKQSLERETGAVEKSGVVSGSEFLGAKMAGVGEGDPMV